MCRERFSIFALVAAFFSGRPLSDGTQPCLACLAEALHDAGDAVEGAIERSPEVTPPPSAP